jgi:hypothetical protein
LIGNQKEKLKVKEVKKMDKGGDFFDFLNYVAEDDPKKRQFGAKILKQIKDSKASAKDLQETFAKKNFKVPIEQCRKLKQINPNLIPDVDPRAGY